MKNKLKILFTSTGLSATPVFEYVNSYIKNSTRNEVVSIITTATKDKEDDKYVVLAKKQFNKLGISDVRYVDFEKSEMVPLDTTIIYVAGGNTYKLMKYLRDVNFIKDLNLLEKQNGLYIGVSAGTIILGNNIDVAKEVGDENLIDLKGLSGLNIFKESFIPHATDIIKQNKELLEKKYKTSIVCIDDKDVVIFEGVLDSLHKKFK